VRTMFDGVTPGAVPAGAQLYAGYLDGMYQSYSALAARYPDAVHVPIAVSAYLNAGAVLDVEAGDATSEQAVNWVLLRRLTGADPTVYCNTSTWSYVRAAFQTHDVPEPHYWVAQYVADPTRVPAIPTGAVALQYYDYGGYDASVVLDHWPGVDLPLPTTPPTTLEDDVNTTSVSGRAGLSWAAGSRHVVQVGYDPAGGDPVLRVVLVLTTGPLVDPQWTFTKGLGTGTYQIPSEHLAACRGVILEQTSAPLITYDVTAV